MNLLLLSAMLAFVLGFSAYRASICTVAAVAEVMSSRTALVFLSFAKVVLWVVLVNGLLVLWMPDLARPAKPHPGIQMALIGGFVFGIGAAINGGCSFSTISKIAQGNIHMAIDPAGFCARRIGRCRRVVADGHRYGSCDAVAQRAGEAWSCSPRWGFGACGKS